jgi:hypothetical protein
LSSAPRHVRHATKENARHFSLWPRTLGWAPSLHDVCLHTAVERPCEICIPCCHARFHCSASFARANSISNTRVWGTASPAFRSSIHGEPPVIRPSSYRVHIRDFEITVCATPKAYLKSMFQDALKMLRTLFANQRSNLRWFCSTTAGGRQPQANDRHRNSLLANYF